jgi:hypothetical protein
VLGAIRVLFWLQVGLENRLQHQNGRHLDHTIFYARDTHSALPPHPNYLRDL